MEHQTPKFNGEYETYGLSWIHIGIQTAWAVSFLAFAGGLAALAVVEGGWGYLWLVPAAVLGFPAYVIARDFRSCAHDVVLDSRGLSACGHRIAFSEISHVVQGGSRFRAYGLPVNIEWDYQIFVQGTAVLNIKQYTKKYRLLCGRIDEEVEAALTPAYWQRIRARETVSFGPRVGVHAKGVLWGKDSVPWRAIGGIQVVRGNVYLSDRRGNSIRDFSPSIRQINNAPILFRVVEEVVAAVRAEEADPGSPRRHS